MSDTEKPTIKEIERGQANLDADELLLQSLGYKQVNKTSFFLLLFTPTRTSIDPFQPFLISPLPIHAVLFCPA